MKITVKNSQAKMRVNPKEIKGVIRKTLSLENKLGSGEMVVFFVDDAQIRELNLVYTGRYLPTDVIAFDNSLNNREIVADIVVSTQSAIRQARVFKTTPLYEVYLYVIHGLLHLLGHKDKTQRQRNLMQKRSEAILASIRNTRYAIRPTSPRLRRTVRRSLNEGGRNTR